MAIFSGSLAVSTAMDDEEDGGAGLGWAYCVFQRSCAFLTLTRAVSSVKGGASDMLQDGAGCARRRSESCQTGGNDTHGMYFKLALCYLSGRDGNKKVN